jgi:DNA-binding MarR family transcriptional regulator
MWAISQAPGLTLAEKGLLYILETHVGAASKATGESWPGLTRLAAEAGVTRRAVYRMLGRLEEAGWVQITRRIENGEPTTNEYRVTPPAGEEPEAPPVH